MMSEALQNAVNTYAEPQPGIIVILDHVFNIVHINHAGAATLGYDPAEMVGKNWFDQYLLPEEGRRLKSLVSRLLTTDPVRLQRFQSAVPTTNGQLCLVQWTNTLIWNRDGSLAGTVCVGALVGQPHQSLDQKAREANEKSKMVLSSFLLAQEKERQQIAHDLNENLSQVLTMCKLLVEDEQQRTNSATLTKVGNYVQQVINRLRNITYWLNPTQLAEIGLEAAIHTLARETAAASQLKIRFNIGKGSQIELLHPDLQLSLFRILQEQIANIIQHSGATEAAIFIDIDKDWVELEISDNGKGFDPAAIPATNGLFIMRSRAENHGGLMHLKTAPGEGCRVRVRLPLDQL